MEICTLRGIEDSVLGVIWHYHSRIGQGPEDLRCLALVVPPGRRLRILDDAGEHERQLFAVRVFLDDGDAPLPAFRIPSWLGSGGRGA